MNLLRMLTSNYILNVGVTSWLLAQIIKLILTLVTTKKVVLERLIGSGGMPSSHSALTCSVAIAMARKMGFDSPEFGLALCFAGVVMYDAMGVRRAAGEQAKVLNRMVFEFEFPFFQLGKQKFSKGKHTGPKQDEPSLERAAEKETAPLLDKELKEFLGHTPIEVVGGCLLGILVSLFMPVV